MLLKNSTIGYLCLFVLTFQNLLYTLCMKHARSRNSSMFVPSSLLIMSETVKFLISLFMLFTKGEIKSSLILILTNPKDSLVSFVSASMYVVQNRLLISALSNLDAITFQVMYQLKLLTTALFSVLILNKKISLIQWFSLILLFFGVSIVNSPSNDKGQSLYVVRNRSFGLLCVIISSIISGFAAVFFEKVLKTTSKSLWLRNTELAFSSLLIGLPVQLLFESDHLTNGGGYFHGFDRLVWFIIFLHSFGGIIVSLVSKYSNNILKAFACSISIVLSCLISVIFFQVHLDHSFMIGALLVTVSSLLYASFPPRQL